MVSVQPYQAYRGEFVYCPHLGDLCLLHDHLLVSDAEGFIISFADAGSPESKAFLESSQAQTLDGDVRMPKMLHNIPRGSFMIPTFCDLHLHAPQFMYQGIGLHLPLMQWLDEYAYKAEERLDSDLELAKVVYARLAERLLENGTGAVLLFGTIKEETNLALAEAMLNAGIRALVGKLSMDISSRPSYVEASTDAALSSARSFIHSCKQLVDHLPAHERLVEPVLTPRFVPTCTDDLLAGLGALAKQEGVRIQSHMAEAHDQVEWVRAERGREDMDVFEMNNLLTPQTVQAHCTFLDENELSRAAAFGTAVAHCPLSNAYFSTKPFPLREALHHGVKVGLGTDIAGGYSMDIMNAMRQAVVVSRMREGERLITNESTHRTSPGASKQTNRSSQSLAIDWKDSLYLATQGGALALNLPAGSGTFQVGSPLDAQQIILFDPVSGQGAGSLDFFGLSDSTGNWKISQEMIEKWWCLGDHRNRTGVWVQGKKLR